MVRLVIAAFYGVLTAIGVWWLVLFSRSRTKEYFAGHGPVIESARPLSISVIAWYMLAGRTDPGPATLSARWLAGVLATVQLVRTICHSVDW